MSGSSLVYPMFAMVVLTATVLGILFRSRVGAVRANPVALQFFRLYQGGVEPEASAKAARHFSNLFEAPTLFYAACLAALVTGQTGTAVVALAWGYVAARLAHAYIHLGGNKLRWRIRAYFTSWLVLLALWIVLVVGIATRG